VRFLERWDGAANTSPVVTGSILLGFDSVFSPWPVCYQRADSTCAGDSPWRHFWSSKLLDQAGQPPGMPSFTLRAVGETVPDSQRFNFAAFLRLFESLRVSLGIGGNVGVSFE